MSDIIHNVQVTSHNRASTENTILSPADGSRTHGNAARGPLEVSGSPAPVGYEITPAGLYKAQLDADSILLCSPLLVTATFSNCNGSGWGRVVSVQNPHGTWRNVSMLDRDLGGSPGKVFAKLNDLGLRVAPGKGKKQDIITTITAWEPSNHQTSVTRVGWADGGCSAFVLPSGTVLGDQRFLSILADPAPSGTGSAVSGTTDKWIGAIGTKCRGNPLLILGVSVALSGPLAQFLNCDMGTGIHFRGASSCGKTTLLRVANSV